MSNDSIQVLLRDMYVNEYDYPNVDKSPHFYFQFSSAFNRLSIKQVRGKYYLCSTFPTRRDGVFEDFNSHCFFYSYMSDSLSDALHDFLSSIITFCEHSLIPADENCTFICGFVECSMRYHHYRWHVTYSGIKLPWQDSPLLNAKHEVLKTKDWNEAVKSYASLIRDVCIECDRGYHS